MLYCFILYFAYNRVVLVYISMEFIRESKHNVINFLSVRHADVFPFSYGNSNTDFNDVFVHYVEPGEGL